MTLQQYMQACGEEIQQHLAQVFQGKEIPRRLQEAMDYSLLAGGKRLRPLLCLAACEAVGGERSHALPAALAFELIHTYSLIHDDLPAMDDDELRRGRPTNHRVYGEALAILAGDGLLTYAFYLLAMESNSLSPQTQLALIKELAQAAGPQGMVGGQVLDIEAEQNLLDGLPHLEQIHLLKTGTLIRGAVRAGAIAAGASPLQLSALTAYAQHVGLAFQMMDDLLDRTGDETLLGKRAGSDQKQGKLTYVDFLGLEGTERQVQEQTRLAKSALREADLNEERLFQLADYLSARQM